MAWRGGGAGLGWELVERGWGWWCVCGGGGGERGGGGRIPVSFSGTSFVEQECITQLVFFYY